MKKAPWILIFAGLSLLLLPLSFTVGQEGGDKKEEGKKEEGKKEEDAQPGSKGSGIKAIIIQVEGERTEVEDIEFREEKLGIISLTKVPTNEYAILRGKAKITIHLSKIQRIDFDGKVARIKGVAGETLEGEVNEDAQYFLFGTVGFGKFELKMTDVRSIELVHPKEPQKFCNSCNRLFVRSDWQYCPYDGAKLKVLK
ncbi:MAG: hypothetical protein ACYTHN_11905 [Planctomycetota bacterium]|jgi:hypothetical protein